MSRLLSRLRHIGFFPILLASVGGFSILSIVELLFLDRRNLFVAPVRAVLDGYRRLESLVGRIFEPVLGPLIARLGDLIQWPLVLEPHWRPLFILGLSIGASVVSVGWRSSERWRAVGFGTALGSASLIGAVIAGAVPLGAGPFAQGAAAAAVAVPLVLAVQWGSAVGGLLCGDREHFQGMLRGSVQFAIAVAGFGFVTATVLGLVPFFREGAAVATLGLGVVLFGGGLVLTGVVLDRPRPQMVGSRILSGFMAAVAILVANGALQLLGV